MEERVSHKGIVINVTEKEVEIKVISGSSCGTCGIKSACGMSETTEKQVSVPKPEGKAFTVGQQVVISMSEKQGGKAVVFAYLIPAIIMIATILILINLNVNELVSSLASVIAVAIYYLILYFFKDRIRKEFRYDIGDN
ncbi:MAG: SoxR reducing system RseC family protein [Candidatus Limimorpha sp.]